MTKETVTVSIHKANGPVITTMTDTVVREIPLTIHYNRDEIATLLCSPSQTISLTLGFLFNEGFIRIPEDVYEIRQDPSNNMIWVEGKPCILQKELMSKRYVSACCGKSRTSFCFANDALMVKPLTSAYVISLQEAYHYVNYLETYLPLFQKTGGVHSGGIGNNGNVLLTSYDIGRHNVFDKLSGEMLSKNLDPETSVIFFSGRVSSEILLKVAKMSVPILIARGAPTDMAVSQAESLNITVVGFAREQRLNIYTCPERVTL